MPGCRRSTRRGDWPDETLEGAVVFEGLASALFELPTDDSAAKFSTGETGSGCIMYGGGWGIEYMPPMIGRYEDSMKAGVCSAWGCGCCR